MHRKIFTAAVAAALLGCGGATTSTLSASTVEAHELAAATELTPASTPDETLVASAAPEATEAPAIDLGTLPAAPWEDAPIGAREAPAPLLRAWDRAENREWCAPIAPRSLGAAAEGARARAGALEGGWAVEFDRRGMPGIARDGSVCTDCGRGVFGIAGTSMTPEELAGEADAPAPSFRDGSHAELEVSEAENVAAATITVTGQGCVYQVWSFLGREHVEELVRELRRVELPASRSAGAMASAAR